MVDYTIEELKSYPVAVSVIITHKKRNNYFAVPCIELRRVTTEPQILKLIISAAYNELPLIMQPYFPDRLKSIASLINKGILTQINGQYQFNF